LQSSYDI